MRLFRILLSKTPESSANSTVKYVWNRPDQKENKWIKRIKSINWSKLKPKALLINLALAETSTFFSAYIYIAIGGLILIGGHFSVYQYELRKSEWNKTALEMLNNQQQLCKILGTPLEPGYIFTRTRKNAETDSLHVRMPVTGTKSGGHLIYETHKTADDKWLFTKMHFHFLDKAGGIVRLIKEPDMKNE